MSILPSTIHIPPASSLSSSTAEPQEVVYIQILHFLTFIPQHTMPVWPTSVSEAAVAKVTRAQHMTAPSHMNSLLHLRLIKSLLLETFFLCSLWHYITLPSSRTAFHIHVFNFQLCASDLWPFPFTSNLQTVSTNNQKFLNLSKWMSPIYLDTIMSK